MLLLLLVLQGVEIFCSYLLFYYIINLLSYLSCVVYFASTTLLAATGTLLLAV